MSLAVDRAEEIHVAWIEWMQERQKYKTETSFMEFAKLRGINEQEVKEWQLQPLSKGE